MIHTIVAPIIVFAVIVLVHEFGHFIFAKKNGVTVHEFGFLKSVMAVILTIAAILIILFITVLLISLMGEVFIFIRTIISEIILHLS